MDGYRLAARAYRTYGVIYWIGGFYLAMHGVGVRGQFRQPVPQRHPRLLRPQAGLRRQIEACEKRR